MWLSLLSRMEKIELASSERLWVTKLTHPEREACREALEVVGE